MYSSSVLVLALAVFGASAQTLVSTGCGLGLNGFSGINGGLLNGVSGIGSTVASTPVLENVPVRLPSILHPTSVQESCNCIKTVVRPQIRKEVFTIPSVQRFVQTTSTPVVETVPYVTGSSVDVPAVGGVVSGTETGLIGGGVTGLGGLVSGVNTGFSGLNGIVSGVNSGFSGLNGIVSGVNSGFSGLNGIVSGVNSGFSGLNGVVSGVNSGFSTVC